MQSYNSVECPSLAGPWSLPASVVFPPPQASTQWDDPAALSQIIGALIGASIAIGLWFFDRRRERKRQMAAEKERDDRFRAILKAGLARMQREMEGLKTQSAAVIATINARVMIGLSDTDESLLSEMRSISERYPINTPNTFEFSDIHLTALSASQSRLLQLVKDDLLDFRIELRGLSTFPAAQSIQEARMFADGVDAKAAQVLSRLGELHQIL